MFNKILRYREEGVIMGHVSTKFSGLLLILSCSLLWHGCNIINPAEQTPTYIHIDSFHFVQSSGVPTLLVTNIQSQKLATLSHQTNIVWVYYNNNPVGIFDLPATIPVMANGSGQLAISPAIIEDGENNSVGVYPFYTIDTFTFAANPNKIINHTPKTGFYSDAKIGIISNFDNNHTNFAAWGGSPGTLVCTSADSLVFEGTHSGAIFLSTPNVDSAVDSTSFSFPISLGGEAYIEFDYNSTVPFYVGLQANLSHVISSTPNYLIGIYPSSGWQKFYLRVDGFTATARGTSYNFYIKAVLSPNQTSGRLLIDNIQLVTF